MIEYKSAAYLEGNALGGGWHYRINRVVKSTGATVYTALLTYENPSNKSDRLYLWLSEFPSIEQARSATQNVLLEWCQAPHYGRESPN